MFYISEFEIDGFWGRMSASAELDDGVNIFIGRNGTGKTTLINILQAVLEVDLRLLSYLEFREVVLKLRDGGLRRTVRVTKDDNPDLPFERVSFKIGRRKFTLPLYQREIEHERFIRHRPSARRELGELRETMDELVNISSISVHRETRQLENEDDYRHRRSGPTSPPIDLRLQELLSRLTEYQLSLAERAGTISNEFQNGVLASILYSNDFDSFELEDAESLSAGQLRVDLTRAYHELGVLDDQIQKRIDEHIEALARSVDAVRRYRSEQEGAITVDDILPLPLFRRTRHITNLSLDAEKKKQEVFEPIRDFANEIGGFFSDKKVSIGPRGSIRVEIEDKPIEISQLSSGEKQILVFLTEALLQRGRFFIFIADEPELSLHIEWQARLLGALKRINPNSQIIIATHSPEIAGAYAEHVVDMSAIVSG